MIGWGRVQQISTVADSTFTLADNLSYRADGLLTALNYGNGIAETRQYDTAGRLSQVGRVSLWSETK